MEVCFFTIKCHVSMETQTATAELRFNLQSVPKILENYIGSCAILYDRCKWHLSYSEEMLTYLEKSLWKLWSADIFHCCVLWLQKWDTEVQSCESGTTREHSTVRWRRQCCW